MKRPTWKRSKLFVAFELLVLILLILWLGGLIARMILTPDRVARIITDAVKERLGVDVLIEEASFIPPRTFTASNIYLVARSEHGLSVLISADKVDVKLGLKGLRKREPEMKEVYLEVLRVFAERSQDGVWNFAALRPARKVETKEGPPATPREFALPKVYVANGVVEFTDRSIPKGPLRARMQNISVGPKGMFAWHDWQPGEPGAQYDGVGICEERTLGQWRAGYAVDLKAPSLRIDLRRPQIDLQLIERWLPEGMRREWSRFAPAGSCDLRLSLDLKRRAAGGPESKILAVLKGSSVRHERFPYTVSALSGNVTISRAGGSFEKIAGSAGQGKVTMNGNFSWPHGGASQYKFLIMGSGIAVDEKLRHALPDRARHVWDQLQPGGGLAAFALDLHGSVGSAPQFRCEGTVQHGKVTYEHFPLPIEEIAGSFTFSKDDLEVKDATGNVAGSPSSTIRTNITGKRSAEGFNLEGEVAAETVAVDEQLKRAIGDKGAFIWDELQPTGRVTGNVKFSTLAGKEKPAITVQLDCSGVSISHVRFPYRFAGLYSWASYENGALQFTRLSTSGGPKAPAGYLIVEGNVLDLDTVPRYELTLSAYGVPIDDRLYAALPEEAKTVWLELKPTGKADFTADVSGGAQGEQGAFAVQADVHDFAATPRGFKVTGGDGSLSYRERLISLSRFRGSLGPLPFELRGIVVQDAGGWSSAMEFTTGQFEISPDLSAALPPKYAEMQKRYFRSGKASLTGSVRTGGPAQEFELHAKLDKLFMQTQLALREMTGDIVMIGERNGEVFDVAARAALDSIQVQWAKITDLDMGIDWNDKGIILRDITGTAYGGNLHADVEIDSVGGTTKSSVFVASARLENLATEEGLAESKVNGAVDVSMSFSANSKENLVSAGGQVKIVDGYLWEVPLFTALLKILPPMGALTTFSNGVIEYQLEPDKISITRLELQSAVLSIDGSGSVGYDRSLDLKLGVRPTIKSIPIPVAGEVVDELLKILGNIGRKAIPFQVSGSFSNPEVTPDVAALPKETLGLLGKILRLFRKES